MFGILAGYEDQNDHETLRKDPVFKLLVDRSPEDPDLGSQPTLSRFENSMSARSLLNLEEFFIQRFVHSLTEPPREIRLDVDVFDDPVVVPVLLYGTADPGLGFARPLLYEVCERLGVEYSIGLGMNKVLKRKTDELLQTAVTAFETTGTPQRPFTGFES